MVDSGCEDYVSREQGLFRFIAKETEQYIQIGNDPTLNAAEKVDKLDVHRGELNKRCQLVDDPTIKEIVSDLRTLSGMQIEEGARKESDDSSFTGKVKIDKKVLQRLALRVLNE